MVSYAIPHFHHFATQSIETECSVSIASDGDAGRRVRVASAQAMLEATRSDHERFSAALGLGQHCPPPLPAPLGVALSVWSLHDGPSRFAIRIPPGTAYGDSDTPPGVGTDLSPITGGLIDGSECAHPKWWVGVGLAHPALMRPNLYPGVAFTTDPTAHTRVDGLVTALNFTDPAIKDDPRATERSRLSAAYVALPCASHGLGIESDWCRGLGFYVRSDMAVYGSERYRTFRGWKHPLFRQRIGDLNGCIYTLQEMDEAEQEARQGRELVPSYGGDAASTRSWVLRAGAIIVVDVYRITRDRSGPNERNAMETRTVVTFAIRDGPSRGGTARSADDEASDGPASDGNPYWHATYIHSEPDSLPQVHPPRGGAALWDYHPAVWLCPYHDPANPYPAAAVSSGVATSTSSSSGSSPDASSPLEVEFVDVPTDYRRPAPPDPYIVSF